MLGSKNCARTRIPLTLNSACHYLRGWEIKFFAELCDILIDSRKHGIIYFLNFRDINLILKITETANHAPATIGRGSNVLTPGSELLVRGKKSHSVHVVSF